MPTLVLECYGGRIRVSAPTGVLDELVIAVSRYAAPARSSGFDSKLDAQPGVDGTWTVRSDSTNIADELAAGPNHLIAVLVDQLHTLFSEHASGVLFVHAGAFRIGSSVIVVPGRSGSGKSSLVAEALRQGAVYYSDDFAVIDPDGMVHPYPRRLGLRLPSGARHHVTPDQLGAETADGPAAIDFVLSTSFASADAIWAPTVVTGSRATLPIIDNTVRARLDPSGVAHMAATLARRAITLAGDRGEATNLISALVDDHLPGLATDNAASVRGDTSH